MILVNKLLAHALKSSLSRLEIIKLFANIVIHRIIDGYFVFLLNLIYFSFDVWKKLSLSSFKIGVLIYIFPLVFANFAEPIHVQLPNERGEVIMFEVFGQNNICELVDILNSKGISRWCPLYKLLTLWILN